MFKRLRNNKGYLPAVMIGMAVAISVIMTVALVETVQNGQLKKNGQSIWAHMLNQCGEGSTDARCIMK